MWLLLFKLQPKKYENKLSLISDLIISGL
jgi:hypothetical protein